MTLGAEVMWLVRPLITIKLISISPYILNRIMETPFQRETHSNIALFFGLGPARAKKFTNNNNFNLLHTDGMQKLSLD